MHSDFLYDVHLFQSLYRHFHILVHMKLYVLVMLHYWYNREVYMQSVFDTENSEGRWSDILPWKEEEKSKMDDT